jgi:phage-related protein
MATNNIVLLDIKIGANQANQSLGDFKASIDEICTKIKQIRTTFENALSFDFGNVNTLRDVISEISDDSGAVINNLSKVNELMEPQGESWIESVIAGIDGFNTITDGLTNIEDISEAISDGLDAIKDKPNEKFNILKALTPETFDLVGDLASRTKQFVCDYQKAVKTATPEVGAFAALFPDMAIAFESSKAKLLELGSSIGTFVAAIPGHIASVALDTATWVKNTAAKVGNSVAQWAQNAATTAWTGICTAATAVTSAFGVVMTFLTSPIGLVVIGITALIVIIALLIANWDAVSVKAKEVWTAVQEKFAAFDEFLKNIFAKDFTEQFGAFGAVLNVFFDSVEGVWNAIKKVFGGIVDFVKNVFAGNWSAAWDSIVQIFTGIWEGIVGYFKPPLNAIIGFINGLISAIVNAVNFVIRAVNKLSIDIPNWDIFGSLAGKTFGLNIPLVSGCEIPYLAKGAVLPANRPFMAIVGDQRHGTNVEAPLATIQEAVAVVMEDQTTAIVAGFNASIGIQRELLSAVLGIRIGDEVIGRAADRYFAKRAAMGGY